RLYGLLHGLPDSGGTALGARRPAGGPGAGGPRCRRGGAGGGGRRPVLAGSGDRSPRSQPRRLLGTAPRRRRARCRRRPVAVRHPAVHLRHLFPYLPGQAGYNKRLRKLATTANWLIRQLAADTSIWSDDVWVVDSTPIECARSREAVHRSDLAGWAEYGYCAS